MLYGRPPFALPFLNGSEFCQSPEHGNDQDGQGDGGGEATDGMAGHTPILAVQNQREDSENEADAHTADEDHEADSAQRLGEAVLGTKRGDTRLTGLLKDIPINTIQLDDHQ